MNNVEKRIQVKVSRFDPSKDNKPYYVTYEVPIVERMTVLGVLNYIYEELDSSLAYYYSCRTGYCGGCILLVNGKLVKACKCLIRGNVTVEPLPKLKVIRDLLTEFKK